MMAVEMFTEAEMDFLGVEATNETFDIMSKKDVQLYQIKGEKDGFISNYDIVENKKLKEGLWTIFRHHGDRTTQLYFTHEFLISNDNPIKWLLQMVKLYQKMS